MKHEHIPFINNYEPVVKSIRLHAKNYLINSGRQSVVLGISGGIDSALVAALIRPVCDEIGIRLIGMSLPSSTNSSEESIRANYVGMDFCHEFSILNINEMYVYLSGRIENSTRFTYYALKQETEQEYNIRQGNIKARLRMIALFNLAQLHKGLVLSTDNWTELLLGFWTLHGDVGNYGMIQYLWKTEVYNLSEHLCETELKGSKRADSLRSCIECHATDGLGVSKSDLDQIMPDWEQRHKTTRSGYQEVDEALQLYLRTGVKPFGYDQIINRHTRTEFKRQDPSSISREDLLILNAK